MLSIVHTAMSQLKDHLIVERKGLSLTFILLVIGVGLGEEFVSRAKCEETFHGEAQLRLYQPKSRQELQYTNAVLNDGRSTSL